MNSDSDEDDYQDEDQDEYQDDYQDEDQDEDQDDYQDEDEGQLFKPSIDAYKRVGLPGNIISSLLGANLGGNFEDIQKNINRLVQDPSDRFIIYIDAISRRMIDMNIINIDQNDIESILMKAKEIRLHVEHKNPTAFIFGYLASRGGTDKTLNKTHVNNVLNMLSRLRDDSVTPPDVIRYARFINTL